MLSGPIAVGMVSVGLAGCATESPRPATAPGPDAATVSAAPTATVPQSAPDRRSGRESAPQPNPVTGATAVQALDPAADAGVELPPGPGRDLVVSACLGCHDLGGITLFSSFYSRDDWHTLVLTMIETGASIAPSEVEAIADYLGRHFGAGSP